MRNSSEESLENVDCEGRVDRASFDISEHVIVDNEGNTGTTCFQQCCSCFQQCCSDLCRFFTSKVGFLLLVFVLLVVIFSCVVSLAQSNDAASATTPVSTPTTQAAQQVAATTARLRTIDQRAVPTRAPTNPTSRTSTTVSATVRRTTVTTVVCQAENGNPWCYNFVPGYLIYSAPSNFCYYFDCIPSFWQSTNGYVAICDDGTYSHSGGVQGACSYHGGVMQPLYSH